MQFREFNLRIIIINCLKFNIVNVKGTFINVVANSVFDFYVSARENFQGSTLVYCFMFFVLILFPYCSVLLNQRYSRAEVLN